MPKRMLAASIALLLGVFAAPAAYAQVDKVLGHVVSWLLQKQIDELERANDPNRPLQEYQGEGKFDARDQYVPRETPKYHELPAYRAPDKAEDTGRPEEARSVVPAPQ